MQIDPSYSDVREDYSELLYEVGRLEDSMRAARQLVTLDPYFGIGWNRAGCRDRARPARRSRGGRAANAPSLPHYIGKFGLLDYALAQGRADEAGPRSRKSKRNCQATPRSRKRCCPGHWRAGG